MAFVLMATTGTAVYAAENAEEQANEETANQGYQDDLREAKEVLTLLYGSVPFEGTGNVSRAEFVKKLTEVTKTAANPPETYYFEDVPAFDENAANIYTAAELGWISGGTVFEPTREILQNDGIRPHGGGTGRFSGRLPQNCGIHRYDRGYRDGRGYSQCG